MRRIRLYAILIAMVTFVACNDEDFDSILTTDLETETFIFSAEGGKQTFVLESNDKWFVSELPEWLNVEVKDFEEISARSVSYTKGKKEVTVIVKTNPDYEERSSEAILSTINGTILKLTITQEKKTKLLTDLESNELNFSYRGGQHSFLLESNEEWTINDIPSWLSVSVIDVEEVDVRSTSYESGEKEITITAEVNSQFETRSAEITLTSLKNQTIILEVVQEKKPELVGYWILSEGYAGSDNSEIAWFDNATGILTKKHFKTINGTTLGDTGNALKIYGSKMYAVISGSGFGANTPHGTSYIEVIDPKNGKSIKRIQFTNTGGDAAKPRNIIFEGGFGYITSYSNELVRLDTLTLEFDSRAALSGKLAEGLAYSNGYIYVCNSGQGEDNKISVVNTETMEETKIITSPMNPTGIVATSSGEIYFNTNYPEYKLYKLTEDDNYEELQGLSVADMIYTNNNIYTSSFDWGTYMGEVNQFNTTTHTHTKLGLDLKSVGIDMLMEYHIGTINESDDLYLSGMGQDVIIFDPATLEIKHAFQTGVANGSGVVAVYK